VNRARRAAVAVSLALALGAAGAQPLPERSIYRIEGSWTDQEGRAMSLASLRGSPVVLVLFYGTCDSICPTVVRDARKLEALLSVADRARTRFVLVTIDPGVDTPERLRAYAEENELDGERWRLLNGGGDQVRVLANALGIKYRPTGAGQYSHSIRITLLDRDGVAVDHAEGADLAIAPLAARVASLLGDDAR
jgi:protein SCO1/2